MRLKAIEMQGFKSFPDKTRITFDSGVTAIIGPNGSGKSNISDAMRWVLGEMSVKSLRGSRMEDVIFNGTAQRSAANCASVSLCIDTEEEYNLANHQTIAPPSEEQNDGSEPAKRAAYSLSDGPEVTVTRKYYRSGESEYYINKKQVRLKDIYELFYDTGIGREGYSVIGQGKIAEVLSQKDDERRSIFEEAAGISKFRYKKLEAERKLRDTEANLVRVNDILSEISSRIGPLAKEAENAKQYLVLNEEKKGLEITLWLERIEFLRQRRVECETDLAAAKLALDNAEREVADCESATDRMLNESYEFARVMSECEREKSEAIHKKGEAEGRKAVCANDISHANETAYAGKTMIEGAERELAEARQSELDCESARREAEEKLAEVSEKCLKAEYDHESARRRSAAVEEELSKAQNAAEILNGEKSALNAKLAAVNASLEASRRTESENRERILAGERRIALLESEAEQIAAEQKAAGKELDALRKEYESASAAVVELNGKINEINEKITAGKVALSADEQRHDQLQRLEQLLEGYSDSVKRVINDCASGIVTDNGRKIEPYGTVSNVISSESEYVIALETALAASVQFIVIDKEADAKACIKYLKDNKLGRATFLPLESVEGRVYDVSRIKNMSGYVGLASEIAKYDKKFEGIVNDLLGRTVIAANIEFASAIARKTGFRVKVVTLDGQIINAGGSYTGGSVHGKVGVFTRAMDIERIAKEIAVRRKAIASLESERTAAFGTLRDRESAIKTLNSDISDKSLALNDIAARYASVGVRIDEERSHISALSGAGEDAARLGAELDSVIKEIELVDSSITHAAVARDKARAGAETAKEAEEEAFRLVNDARMELYTRRNELAVAGERLDLCRGRTKELEARIELGKNSVLKAEEIIKERTAETGRLNAECAECDSVIASCDFRLKSLMSGREEKERELNAMRARQKTASAVKEEAFRAYTTGESKRDSVNSEYDSVSAKLWDEYELTYSDALSFRLPKEKMDKAPSRLASLRSKIRSMGTINVNAVEEYRVTKERFDFLTAQTEDLNKTRASLDRTINKLASGMKETFLEYFDKINTEFNAVFTELFGGGSARVELTDPLLPLECGIEIILKVPGKSVRSISLLSGGEQSFAAISLYLALQRVNPAPFCVFDEIESALDDVNIIKFASYIRRNSDKTQYIIITHRRGTMEHADTLYGITMHQKGISDYMRLNMAKLDDRFKENIN